MNRVLVPYDFSSNARRALALAMQGFPFGLDAELELLHVVDSDLYENVLASKFVPSDDAIQSYLHDEITQVRSELEIANGATSQLELLEPKPKVVRGRPHACIDARMSEPEVVGIVLGGQGHGGASERLLGRTAQRVVRHAELPVLVVKRGRALTLPTRLTTGIDWSPGSRRALAKAAVLRATHEARLDVVHVVDSPYVPYMKAFAHERDAAEAVDEIRDEQLDKLASFVQTTLEEVDAKLDKIRELVLFGDPAETIAAHARTSLSELVVVGGHGRSDVARFLLGSTAEKLITRTSSDVLVMA